MRRASIRKCRIGKPKSGEYYCILGITLQGDVRLAAVGYNNSNYMIIVKAFEWPSFIVSGTWAAKDHNGAWFACEQPPQWDSVRKCFKP